MKAVGFSAVFVGYRIRLRVPSFDAGLLELPGFADQPDQCRVDSKPVCHPVGSWNAGAAASCQCSPCGTTENRYAHQGKNYFSSILLLH